MTTLIVCLFIATLLPILAKVPVAMSMHRLSGYDNHHPRAQQAKLTGIGARALAAHQNAFESLAIFAPAVLLAIATNNTGIMIEQLAISHVIARLLYHVAYILDWALFRSFIWALGMISAFSIFVLCL
ncbi:Uncharacterized conserved protein, MAPEG superfamily [Colwellia chukchiensis]|uniref:Uncharacterized conserved protein, MAPEG superfamily n=1 Tax=Colwellia chukchiensis TaxID=641665 RepID=A0A1H7HN67_9GAMM|nr:MAPEG family protein [Colwellia chukchiensis]SEK51731.1 Uncharacterized conserved protein, MAPEG superfamily [Colwellia chukchiensis]